MFPDEKVNVRRQHQDLDAAGWRPQEEDDRTPYWEDPVTGKLYRQTAAHFLLQLREQKERDDKYLV